MLLRSSLARARAAGVTWALRTASAPWAVRSSHTTVIDAAGAIYVIGGYNYLYSPLVGGGTDFYFKDVWVSTDGGDSGVGMGTEGIPRAYSGVQRAYSKAGMVLKGYLRGLSLILVFFAGTRGTHAYSEVPAWY